MNIICNFTFCTAIFVVFFQADPCPLYCHCPCSPPLHLLLITLPPPPITKLQLTIPSQYRIHRCTGRGVRQCQMALPHGEEHTVVAAKILPLYPPVILNHTHPWAKRPTPSQWPTRNLSKVSMWRGEVSTVFQSFSRSRSTWHHGEDTWIAPCCFFSSVKQLQCVLHSFSIFQDNNCFFK